MRGGRAALRRPPAASSATLVAQGVWKRFGSATAIAGVDLRVEAGTVVLDGTALVYQEPL